MRVKFRIGKRREEAMRTEEEFEDENRGKQVAGMLMLLDLITQGND